MQEYHPIQNLIYFVMVIGFTMFLEHPVFLGISLFGGLCYTLLRFGIKPSLKGLSALFFLMLFTAVVNPAFSHQGVTVLAQLPTGNMLTLESVRYGISMACRLAAVLLWFRCMGAVMTSDKMVYLFGKSFPVLGLLLSMVLGFLPKMQKKIQDMALASGTTQNIRQGMDKLAALIMWELEDSIIRADSMKGRGYGLGGRTSFTVFRFTKKDRRMCVFLCGLSLFLLAGVVWGYTSWYYYPETAHIRTDGWSILFYLGYAVLCWMPSVLKGWEWRRFVRIRIWEQPDSEAQNRRD